MIGFKHVVFETSFVCCECPKDVSKSSCVVHLQNAVIKYNIVILSASVVVITFFCFVDKTNKRITINSILSDSLINNNAKDPIFFYPKCLA